MKWHDCKTNPPKKNGHYIIQTTSRYDKGDWIGVCFYLGGKEINPYVNEECGIGHWFDDYEEYICYDDCADKWAEVDLSEDD